MLHIQCMNQILLIDAMISIVYNYHAATDAWEDACDVLCPLHQVSIVRKTLL